MSCARPNTPRSNPKAVGELAEPLRSRIAQAIRDAPTGGLVLVSGLRDAGRQWDLRHERCRGRECDRSCKGYPVTAVPWSSKHQTGEAADMGGRDLDWLIANRARYGLGLTVRSENWHFQATGVDTRTGHRIGAPTVTIRPYGATITPPKPKPPTPKDDFMALTDSEQRELLAAARRVDDLTAKVDRLAKQSDTVRGDIWAVLAAVRPVRQAVDAIHSRVASMHQGRYGDVDGYAGGDLGWLDDRLKWSELRVAKAVTAAVRDLLAKK